MDPLAATLAPVCVLVVGFLLTDLGGVLFRPPVLLLGVVFPAAVLALAEMAALVGLPEPVEAVTRVVKNEPRTASSSPWAPAPPAAPAITARLRKKLRVLKRIITPEYLVCGQV